MASNTFTFDMASTNTGSSSTLAPLATVLPLLQLHTQGYAVVPDVLSTLEINQAVQGIQDWLTYFTSVTGNWPYCLGLKGLLQHYRSLSHCQAVWNVRQHPNVHDVFSKIWWDNDLLVSFDGVGIQRPPEQTKKYADPNGAWPHIDQGPSPGGFQCVQGFVNLVETTSKDGCLIVYPGSHLLHAQFYQAFPTFDKNWCPLTEEQKLWYHSRGCTPVRVTAPAGSLVLWDSRTVHTNSTATQDRYEPDKYRMVVYVCMTPRKWAGEKDLAKKRTYFETGRITSHWPHKIKVFSREPRSYGDHTYDPHWKLDDSLWRLPQLTPLGYRLAGYY